MSDELKISIGFLDKILGGEEMTIEATSELFEIHNGNQEVIRGHLKAIVSIMTKALEKLEIEKQN